MAALSVCLIAYHEEARVEACLESFADLVDEIVVFHDGPCSDATLSIARRFTDKVFSTGGRAGSAEFIRPLALEHCTGEWVLCLDADERLSPPLRQALRSLVENADADGYGFAWPYVDENGRRLTTLSMSGKKFLFRRSSMYTIGLPHMTPDTYGVSVAMPLEVHHVLTDGLALETFGSLLRKNLRRGRAAAATLAQGIDRVVLFNASLFDNRVKNARKIRLLASHPLLALLVLPAYGFLYWYFAQGYFKAGRIGLHDALNLPLYYASFAWNLLARRMGPRR